MGQAWSSLRLAVAPLERILSGGEGPVPPPPIASELRAIASRLRELALTEGRAPSTLRREGEYWTLTHDGAVVRLRHAKGVAHLAQLLAQPNAELHVLALEHHRPDERAAAAPRLDHAAKAVYRARLAALRGDRTDDAATRPDRHAAEIDALVRELAEGVGLGGRDRHFACAAERARVNVTRNLRAAIARASRVDGALGRHLALSVRTGTFCCYQPDPALAIRWLVTS